MEISRITSKLYIGTTPKRGDYALLHDLGVKLVINMRFERRPVPDPHNPPMTILWLRTFDTPLIPIPVQALEEGVHAALEVLNQGGAVYAYCAGGVHRSVAMAAAILIAQGYSADTAMLCIKQNRKAADPDAWHIRRQIQRFAERWANNLAP